MSRQQCPERHLYTETRPRVAVRRGGAGAQVLELENKNEKIVAFAWEPKGHRFAIIHGDGPRPDITFYTMEVRGCATAPPASSPR